MKKRKKLVFSVGGLFVLGISFGLIYKGYFKLDSRLHGNDGQKNSPHSQVSAPQVLDKFKVDVSKPYEGQAQDMRYEESEKLFGQEGTDADSRDTETDTSPTASALVSVPRESASVPKENPLGFVNKMRVPIVESQLAASLQDLGVEEGENRLPLAQREGVGQGEGKTASVPAVAATESSKTKFGTKTKKGWGQADEESSLLFSAPFEEIKKGTPHSKDNLNPSSEQSKRASKLARQRQVNIFKEQNLPPDPNAKLKIAQEEDAKLREQNMLKTSSKIAKVVAGIGTPMDLSDVVSALAQVSMEGRGHGVWDIAGKILEESGSGGAYLETTGISNLLVASAPQEKIKNPKNTGIRFEAEKGTYVPGAGMSKTLTESSKGLAGGATLPGGAKIQKDTDGPQEPGKPQVSPPLKGFDFSGYEYAPADPKFICPICGKKSLDVFSNIGGGPGASTLNAKVGLNKANVSSLGDFMSATWALK